MRVWERLKDSASLSEVWSLGAPTWGAIMWSSKVSGEPRKGVMTWSNKQRILHQGVATHTRTNQKQQRKNNLQIETTNLTKQRNIKYIT